MDRLSQILFRALAIVAILLGGYAPAAQKAAAATPLCGSISSDTILSLASSPYLVCAAGVIVPAGRTLTIDPGVTVQFTAGVGNYLTVQGTLVAMGTLSQVITLAGATASPGSWGGISAVGTSLIPAHVSLDYIVINFGGYAGSYGAALYADQALVSIAHSQIANSAGNGVYVSISAHLDAHAISFVGNAQNAIQLNQPSASLLMTELTASGNGTDGVRLVGTSTFHGVQHIAFPGIPYVVDAPLGNDLGDELTIDPGNILEFTPLGWLYIRGRLNAVGTPSQPILLTGLTQSAGSWKGLFIDGGVHQAVAQLDYVTLEYAGSGTGGANIEVANGRLNVHHSIIRHSATDGVRFDSNWGGSILESQILDNADHGVRNVTPGRAVLATNNWWGDVNGPQSDVVGCSTGLGNKVTSGVLFNPVLPGTNTTAVLPLSSAPILTITPRRWFAPADGLTRIYFDITVRDGNGAPVPGRTVKISTSLGTTFDGGLTDPTGKALAYLTSPTVGDATVTASLTPLTACDGSLSPETKVTFTAPVSGTDLLPNAPASYFDGNISVSPMPVVTGVPTTISAKLTNPTPTAITVDVSFGFAQSGIGLVFGPIGNDITGQVIPANSSVTLSEPFLPVVSGHYCFQVTYTITAIGSLHVNQTQGPGSGSSRLNINAWQGSMGPPSSKDSLNKADKAFRLVSKLPSGPTQIQKGILGQWWGAMKKAASDISKGLGFDPPRQDYNQVTMPVWHPIPAVLAGPNISTARAAALNAVNGSLTEIEGYGTAATTAMDRYGGASEANNLQWASEQANELLYYEELLGTALVNYADHLDAFVLVLQTEAESAVTVSLSDVTSYQLRLSTSGFNSDEIAIAKSIGMSDAQIETFRQEIIAANPNELTGSLLTMYTNEASISRDLGNALLHPPVFDTGFHVSAGSVAATSVQAAGNSMVQIYNTVATVQLSNPLAQAALIDVSVRRIDLPADWSVSVTPTQVTLAPGEVTPITVTILAGSPIPQGDHPRVAVEGYAGSVLLGGVVIETVIPYYQPFDGKLHLFLPVTRK